MTFSPRSVLFGLVLLAALAAAQPVGPQCSLNAASVASIRGNGEAEPLSDLVLTCSGGTPTAAGVTVPGFNFTVTASVPITSRLLAPNWSEALLLADEPSPGSQLACPAPGGTCATSGNGNGMGTYNGSAGHPNVFQGQQTSQNAVTFPGVPFDPPAPGGSRIFRITNIRVNPSALAAQAQIPLAVTITGAVTIPVSPSQTVAGTTFTAVTVAQKGVQTGANGLAQFSLSFTESFPSAFRTRSSAVDPVTSPAPANQATPNQFLPGVETHFYNSSLPFTQGRGNLGLAGLADNGTRLLAVFTGIPQGVSLITNTTVALTPGSGVARLVTTDANGTGAFQPAPTTTLFPDRTGTIIAAFEILVDDPQTIEQANIPFAVSYSNGATALQTISASAGLAPQSTSTSADLTAPLPRFTSLTSFQVSALSISPTSILQGSVGAPYSQLFTVTGGSGPYSWSALGLPGGLSISASGILNGTPTTAGSFSIVVAVSDSTGSTTSIQLTLTIANGFTITTTTIPNGTVGIAYSTQIASAGGQLPVTFVIAPSTIFGQSIAPPGLKLSPAGVLAGTPLTAGTYSFIVTATDQGNHQASQTYKVTIAPPLVISTVSPLPTGVAGGGLQQIFFLAQGGTPPYTFAIVDTPPPGLTLTPGGILTGNPTAAGTFTFTVSVTDAQQIQVTKKFQITFTAAPALLQVSSNQLNFSALFGGDSPAPQTLVVTSSSDLPVNFSIQLDSGTTGSAVPRWLSVQATQGVTPAGIVVVVDQSSLVIGIADARIVLTVTGDATRAPVAIGVHLDIAAGAPVLDVSPNLLRLRAHAATPGVQTATLLVRDTGGSGPINFAPTVVNSSPWITGVSVAAPQTSFNGATAVTVTFNSQGLNPGTVRDIIRFTWSQGVVDVPVSLYVAPTGSYLGLDTRGLRFQARQGAGSSFHQTVRILNLGDSGTIVNWSANLVTGSDWLALSTSRGTSTTAQPGALVLTPGPNAVNLAAGPHYALVQINDQLSIGSPQYVVAVLDIAASTAPPLPELSTGFLYFATTQGSTAQTGGTVTVYTSSLTPANFQVATATSDGSNWLQASPSSAAASTGAPGQVTVVINPGGLNAGVYKGQVNVAMSGVLRTKDVTLVILPGVGFTQINGIQSDATMSCAPSQLALTLGNLTTSFDLPAQFPAQLSVQLTDNCNSPVTNASVVATFSNGDSPLTLAGDGVSDIYADSWQPGVAQPNMSVTIRASAAPYPEASLVLTGNMEPNVAPVLNRGGTVNNSYVQLDAPLAPGTVVALFGANLATQTTSPGVLPLLNTVNGTSVLVGGIQLPLYYVSAGQIDAQLPVELPLNRPQAVIVANNGAYTLPDNINVTAVSPGVAAYATGAVIAQHPDFSLVDAGHPAHPGETIVMYLVGMGATNPSTPTGQQTTGPLEPAVVQPTMMVDNQPASVAFAGLTPGGIGLYQINFQVPLGARSGTLNVVVAQGTIAANTTTLVVAP
jgi:uncharacterized protein (TIGR03437 family)